MHRFRKAVQQQDQWRPGRAGGDGIEDEMRRNSDLFLDGHGAILDGQSGQSMVRHIQRGGRNCATLEKCCIGSRIEARGDGRLHYLRSILFDAAVVILTLVISLSVPFMVLFKAGSTTVRAVSQVWANGIMFLMKYVVGLDYRVEGREHVPDGPCIIACNHQSLWETAALCVIFPDASIVAKKELRKLPLVGWFLERYPMILVDRSAGRQALRQMVDEARRAVGEGRKALLFPQGTRQAIDEPMTFQSAGISALYTNLEVPVVPAACNSGLFWGKKTLMMHSGTITLSFLPPIPPGLPRKEFQEKMERMIAEEAKRLLTVTEAKAAR
jgi:1-acyl-sn-glycerol-3-phosphate acyltransferase